MEVVKKFLCNAGFLIVVTGIVASGYINSSACVFLESGIYSSIGFVEGCLSVLHHSSLDNKTL